MKNQFKYFTYLFLGCLTVAAFASARGKKQKMTGRSGGAQTVTGFQKKPVS